MNDQPTVRITLPADVSQIDQTGYVWTFLDRAAEPERVVPGALLVAGDEEEPFLARVVDVVSGPGERKLVHLDAVGVPEQAIDELRHARLLRVAAAGPRQGAGGRSRDPGGHVQRCLRGSRPRRG